MILINHPHISIIAAQYADDLYKQFENKKGIIDRILEILLSTSDYDRNIHVNKGLPALKLILNKTELQIPKGKTKKHKTEILYHNIDINRIRADKRSKCSKRIRYSFIDSQLKLIFNSNSLKTLFSAEIGELKKLNQAFTDGGKLDSRVYAYFFDYEKYYQTLNKYIGQELGIICCPYCNRNYITYVASETERRIIGPTYDHFFNKGTYKFCALSFFNLIPSCYVCNSNLKNAINFDLATHLYPYTDEFGKNAFFDFDLKLVDTSAEKKIIFKPIIKLAEGISPEDELKLIGKKIDDKGQVTGSIKVFRLREIYETHYDTVEEVHEKFDANSPYYIKSIKEKLKLMGVGEDEFYRFHFHNYYDNSNFHRRPLAQLSKDIYLKMKQIQEDASTGI
jgi:hypothetical protein